MELVDDMAQEAESVHAVHRFQVSTQQESQTEEFIRQMFVGNRLRFLSAPAGASFSADVAQAGELAVSRMRSSVDYSARTDPFDHFLFFSMGHGRLKMRNGRQESLVASGDVSFYPLDVPLEMDMLDIGALVVSRN
ncbi:hypothetical protein [Cryptosporangium phraense]|uniref:Transcription regulator HTH AraC- type ligand binding domain-containing protein n=1 Tax=Cryptosporangium phraense TaxID=2593070 RepID=A0A545AUY1_9ACTN|nr:hypothetical protein [Cryptosporangium phraense]TQS45081.1 hypothetical protein FL583_11320 [Cryptosporangium phraense]